MQGQLTYALIDVSEAIKRPTGAAQLKALFASDAILKTKMIQAVNAKIDGINGSESAKQCKDAILQIASAGILDSVEITGMQTRYDTGVRKGNESGSIPFVLDGYVGTIPALADSRQIRLMFDRTMRSYKDRAFTPRNMQAVIAYLQMPGADPALVSEFKVQLPTLNVRSAELDHVALIDPGFANRRKAQLTLNAHLAVKNADRLFADDVGARLLQNIRGVSWVPNEKPGAIELVVERVRDTEKVLPVESRTVTYSYAQVDILKAALLMPKNASYQYELKSGGAELEYGYVISAWKNGVKLSENVLRGKLGGSYRKCESARVVNVFGGVTSAGFIANADMERACASQSEVSMDGLRSELLTKISEEVLKMPEVSEVHTMNL